MLIVLPHLLYYPAFFAFWRRRPQHDIFDSGIILLERVIWFREWLLIKRETPFFPP